MSLLDSIADCLGLRKPPPPALPTAPASPFIGRVQGEAVVSRWEEGLVPVGRRTVAAGRLVELHSIVTGEAVAANPVARFDVRHLPPDDRPDAAVVSLTGTGAAAPAGVTAIALTTVVQALPEGTTLAEHVEAFKRATPDYASRLLVVTDAPADGVRQTHVLAWWRVVRPADTRADAPLFFVFGLTRENRPPLEDSPLEALAVSAAVPGLLVRLTGTVVDAHPNVAGTPEPLATIEVTAGGRSASTGAQGTFLLDTWLTLGANEVRIGRSGTVPQTLTATVTAAADGRVTVALTGPGNLAVGSATTAAVPDAATRLDVAVAEIRLVVHKLRGTVHWPSEPRTPLADRRVYALPVPAATLAAARPRTTDELERLKERPGVLRSTRLGAVAGRTAADGRFEIKFVDLRVDRHHLIWVESHDPRDAAPANADRDTPEYVVRTIVRDLLRMPANASTTANPLDGLGNPGGALATATPRRLVEHEYNLTLDRVTWAADVVRVVRWHVDVNAPDDDTATLKLIRPSVDQPAAVPAWTAAQAKAEFAQATMGAGRRVDALDITAQQVVDGLVLEVLPLVPLGESPQAQPERVRRLEAGLAEAAAVQFPDGARVDARFGLDAQRMAGSPVQRMALLETTLLVRPQLRTGGNLLPTQARWKIDGQALAEAALVDPGATPAVLANRQLAHDLVPVLGTVSPRLLGLAAERHVYLVPGHGLFPLGFNSANMANWRSTRGGYSSDAGEDENVAVITAECVRIARQNRLAVTACREVEDYTRAGFIQTGAHTFAAVADPDFMRLWQQNALYYFGAGADPVIRTRLIDFGGHNGWPEVIPPQVPLPTGPTMLDVGATGGSKNGAGIFARVAKARFMPTLDLFLAPHTNAGQAASTGSQMLYLDVARSTANAATANQRAIDFAIRVQDRVTQRCHTRSPGAVTAAGRAGVHSVRENNAPDSNWELENTFEHWQRQPAAATPNRNAWDRVLARPAAVPAGNSEGPAANPPGGDWMLIDWPHAAPAAIAEVAFHNGTQDALLLAQGWFRRLAGEGLALGVEDELRMTDRELTADDVRRVAEAAFGATAAVAALPVGTAVRTQPQFVADIATITATAGATLSAAAGAGNPVRPLDALCRAIRRAAEDSTRSAFVVALRTALATLGGYAAGDAEIDDYVERQLLAGARLGDLSRPNAPLTRVDAAVFIARAVGLATHDLPTVTRTAIGQPNVPLIPDITEQERAFCPRGEAAAIVDRVRALAATDVYRAGDLYLADARLRPLRDDAHRYVLPLDTPVVVVADTRGVAWKLGALTDVRLVVDPGTGARTLACAARGPRRLQSAAWAVDIPRTAANRPADVTLRAEVRHRGAWQTIGTQRITVEVR